MKHIGIISFAPHGKAICNKQRDKKKEEEGCLSTQPLTRIVLTAELVMRSARLVNSDVCTSSNDPVAD